MAARDLAAPARTTGNVARDAAEARADLHIQIATRDVDVLLSERGFERSNALAGWFAVLPVAQRPSVVLHSPYVCAADTAASSPTRWARPPPAP